MTKIYSMGLKLGVLGKFFAALGCKEDICLYSLGILDNKMTTILAITVLPEKKLQF